jgi:hypothetical protein
MKRLRARTTLVVIGLAALTFGLVLTRTPASGALTAAILVGLVGGSAGCSFGYGLAAGLGISSRVASAIPGAQVTAVALGITAIVVGFVTNLRC